ncbi:Clp protease ClpP [Corynebacterium tuberculostearicum]|uniref:head maturation protease, ClpP-related n=1 Tax=Corynebacterium tuberculostearicum TaxID=38304 RepID=UPI002665DFCA|nr:head maturation protease, ClpP-related [Corynebacterium tuberculostearicum]WKE50344.1 Clp protease ClpP [Corynebacterium tuberculostearicum]
MSEILLHGPIGPDFWEPENAITAKSVMAQLSEISGDVTVRISSGGGDVYEGIDIMNALKGHDGEVTVIVESLAASAASFIAVGGADKVLMRDSSEMMIHRAWTFADGNADDVRKTLDDLERQDNKLAAIYAGKAGGELQDWLDAMSAETWYTAEEAVAAGLADGIVAEKSSAPAPSASLAKRRFKFANRAAAPPPPVTRSESGDKTTTPSDGQEGDAMSIKNLAQELGVQPDVLREKLSGFFNEEVTVTATVDLTYPENNTVVPTGDVQVAPNEDVPAGVTFELTGAPEDWTGEVAEDTGVLKVTAPSNVEPDTEVQFTVSVNGGSGEPVELTVPVTVKAAANTEEETTQETTSAPAAPAEDTVTLDAETYAELKAAAQHGWKAMEEQKEASLVAEVDGWIKEGRISAARRAKAIAAMKRDPEAARDIYGSNPAGTIPRAEIGYGKDAEPDETKTVRAKADKVGFLTRKNFH